MVVSVCITVFFKASKLHRALSSCTRSLRVGRGPVRRRLLNRNVARIHCPSSTFSPTRCARQRKANAHVDATASGLSVTDRGRATLTRRARPDPPAPLWYMTKYHMGTITRSLSLPPSLAHIWTVFLPFLTSFPVPSSIDRASLSFLGHSATLELMGGRKGEPRDERRRE